MKVIIFYCEGQATKRGGEGEKVSKKLVKQVDYLTVSLYNISDRDDYTLALAQKLKELGLEEETK